MYSHTPPLASQQRGMRRCKLHMKITASTKHQAAQEIPRPMQNGRLTRTMRARTAMVFKLWALAARFHESLNTLFCLAP